MALTKVSTQLISAIGEGNIGQVLTADINGNFNWVNSTTLEVDATNVDGTIATAQTATTITGSEQPNITSVGTLTTLAVSGNVSFDNNLSMTGFTETVVATVNTGSSIAPNAITGTVYHYTANANFTFNGFTNPVAGQSAAVVITQDGTGSRVMTSTMKFMGGNKTLSTAPGAIDLICVLFTGTMYLASLTKGYT